jgi:ABC-type branched-subunit amino acid transport system substrate-binding protein
MAGKTEMRTTSAGATSAGTSLAFAAVMALFGCFNAVAGEAKYDVGATDAEIRVGNTMPYSGQGSAWGLLGKAEAAYFDKVNAEGGVNGRKIKFISYDDGYSPPKTVEQVRRLVRTMRFCSCSARLVFRPIRRSTNT